MATNDASETMIHGERCAAAECGQVEAVLVEAVGNRASNKGASVIQSTLLVGSR